MRNYKITRDKGEWYNVEVTDSYGNDYQNYFEINQLLFLNSLNFPIKSINLFKKTHGVFFKQIFIALINTQIRIPAHFNHNKIMQYR